MFLKEEEEKENEMKNKRTNEKKRRKIFLLENRMQTITEVP